MQFLGRTLRKVELRGCYSYYVFNEGHFQEQTVKPVDDIDGYEEVSTRSVPCVVLLGEEYLDVIVIPKTEFEREYFCDIQNKNVKVFAEVK